MRWLLAAVVASSCAGWAQDDATDLLEPLRHGRLVVWVVAPAKKVDPHLGQFKSPTPGYTESTTGNLGQTSSSYGQTAGGYGVASDSSSIAVPTQEQRAAAAANGALPGYKEQTSGSFGTDSSNVGTVASNHGTDVSGLGQTAGSYGTDASNHGQTAGSFGTASSNYGASSYGAGLTPTAVTALRQKLKAVDFVPGPTREMNRFLSNLRGSFREAHIAFAQVDADALRFDLKLVAGSEDYPDVLVGSLPDDWKGMQREFGVMGLQPAAFVDDGLREAPEPSVAPPYSVMLKAPHRDAARAFAVWMVEGMPRCRDCGWGDNQEAAKAAELAASAVQRLIQGHGLGDDADPEMVQLADGLGARILMTVDNSQLDPLGVRVRPVFARSNGHLAAVSVRVTADGNAVFGLAHPLVVLRKGGDGKWKVLQVSLNLPMEEQMEQMQRLTDSTPVQRAERQAGVLGVSQASPNDEERVPVKPDLWWDNGGGAGLEVVEWQKGSASEETRLFLVPDQDPVLKTRVTARFAGQAGAYRWRVWSVGEDGAMKISEWKTMVVGP